jgi:alginate O-acetyltransferase complex protein AlgI
MLFNSFTFILFLAVIIALRYSPLTWRVKRLWLLVGSYAFYAAWNPPFVALLWVSTWTDWIVARRIYRCQTRRARRVFLVISLSINLGLLAFFKYSNFFLESLGNICTFWRVGGSLPLLDVVLPVGISFYTFQTLSYTLDIFRGRGRPWHSFLDYALYVAFFPQLVAGPIVRAFHFLPQCLRERRPTGDEFAWAMSLFSLGLFEKIVLADGLLAPIVETVYDAKGPVDVLSAWCATLAFSSQIFCDFSGYSLCAVGIAKSLGFSIPDNFYFPYASLGFSEFWRRWHISLSTWFRDYLYIPLGGSRRGPFRNTLNVIVTMLFVGLWHGASWRFVLWGGIHGFLILAERLVKRFVPQWDVWKKSSGKLFLCLITFVFISIAWSFFRAESLDRAFLILQNMFGIGVGFSGLRLKDSDVVIAISLTVSIFFTQWLMRNRSLEWLATCSAWWARSLALAGILILIVLGAGEDRAFIYFQF